MIIAITSIVTLEFFIFCQKNFISPAKSKLMAANFARGEMERLTWESSSLLLGGTTPIPELKNGLSTVAVTTKPEYKLIEVSVTWGS